MTWAKGDLPFANAANGESVLSFWEGLNEPKGALPDAPNPGVKLPLLSVSIWPKDGLLKAGELFVDLANDPNPV